MPYTITNLQNGDLFELSAFCYYQGQAGINVTHIACTFTDTSNLDMQDLVDDYEITLRPLYAAILPLSATFRGCTLRRIRSAKSATFYSSHTGTVGTVDEDTLPTQLAPIIKLTANVAGRRGRGRLYLPFPPVTANVLGSVAPGYVADAQDIADAYNTVRVHNDVDTIHVNHFSMAIRHANAPGSTDDTWDLVQTATALDKFATQRRRGRYGKPNMTAW